MGGTMQIHEPVCARCGPGYIQIIDWSPARHLQTKGRPGSGGASVRVSLAEVVYVCHGCDCPYSHYVPHEWAPPGGWLPDLA